MNASVIPWGKVDEPEEIPASPAFPRDEETPERTLA